MSLHTMQVTTGLDPLQVLEQEETHTLPDTETVLLNKIPWSSIAKGNTISRQDESLLQNYDKHSAEVKASILDEQGPVYAELFLRLLLQIHTPEHRAYIVALVDEMLTLDENYTSLFMGLRAVNPAYPFEPFVRLLSSSGGDKPAEDHYMSSTAAKILALLIVKSPSVDEDLPRAIFNWFNQRLHESHSVDETVFALSALQVLLRKNEYRIQFASKDGINQLLPLVRIDQHRQVLYQAVFSLWLLSFYRPVAAGHFPRTRAVQALSKLLGVVTADKVVRITILTLNNLAGRGRCCQEMIESGVLKKVNNLSSTAIADPELKAAVESLKTVLRTELQQMSSWERYLAELISGNLEWSISHKSERFWRENVLRFEDDKFRALGILTELMRVSTDENVISIALHDVGEFARYHPRGRTILDEIPDVKVAVMAHLDSPSPLIQRHALLCLQKMMITNWEFLP
eukprot:CAMPEP_0174229450 /NCGR_PEP_ID=MMETSP0417-20130205/427_1 /TAXON_ID=242541 /ORGANISM="Mayorella sp, Strain BSH-02190019" /LENGTH=457 /DNA_ID=CAMNT_0015306997 /DNA_START=71 /DNA_END=1441 /DNA_ORIENTATION=+